MQSSINAHIICRHENRHGIGYNYAYVENVIVGVVVYLTVKVNHYNYILVTDVQSQKNIF